MVFHFQRVNFLSDIRNSLERMYCSPSHSIALVCLCKLQLSDYAVRSHQAIFTRTAHVLMSLQKKRSVLVLKSKLRILKLLLLTVSVLLPLNMKFFNHWISQRQKFQSSRTQFTGFNSSHLTDNRT